MNTLHASCRRYAIVCAVAVLTTILDVSIAGASPVVYSRLPLCYQNQCGPGVAVPAPNMGPNAYLDLLQPIEFTADTLIDQIDYWATGASMFTIRKVADVGTTLPLNLNAPAVTLRPAQIIGEFFGYDLNCPGTSCPYYKFSSTLTAPFLAEANVPYYLSIDTLWLRGLGGVGTTTDFPWVLNPIYCSGGHAPCPAGNGAFELHGTVPEPATILLVGAGLLAIARRARHPRAR